MHCFKMKMQLKDFLLKYLNIEPLIHLLWWVNQDEDRFCIKLTDGRKDRSNPRCAELAKKWEEANGRTSSSNSKMTFKEALKRSPYILELSRNNGEHTFKFVQKGFKRNCKKMTKKELALAAAEMEINNNDGDNLLLAFIRNSIELAVINSLASLFGDRKYKFSLSQYDIVFMNESENILKSKIDAIANAVCQKLPQFCGNLEVSVSFGEDSTSVVCDVTVKAVGSNPSSPASPDSSSTSDDDDPRLLDHQYSAEPILHPRSDALPCYADQLTPNVTIPEEMIVTFTHDISNMNSDGLISEPYLVKSNAGSNSDALCYSAEELSRGVMIASEMVLVPTLDIPSDENFMDLQLMLSSSLPEDGDAAEIENDMSDLLKEFGLEDDELDMEDISLKGIEKLSCEANLFCD